MADNQRFIGSICTGCGKPSEPSEMRGGLGGVAQRDLGSADKWHLKCYRDDQRATVALTAVSTGRQNRDGWECDGWKVTLRYQGRQMSLPFYKGIGHHGDQPTVSEVIENLFMTTTDPGMTFEEYCDDFGLNVDSRRQLNDFRATRALGKRWARFIGDDAGKLAIRYAPDVADSMGLTA